MRKARHANEKRNFDPSRGIDPKADRPHGSDNPFHDQKGTHKARAYQFFPQKAQLAGILQRVGI